MLVELQCEGCVTCFTVSPYRASTARYCSSKCQADAKRKEPTLICSGCGVPKQPGDFYVDNHKPRGRVARCKSCYKAQQKKDRIHLPRRRFFETKSNAARRGFSWNISFEWYVKWIWKARCIYCGGDSMGGVDRMQNEPFYSPENAVACCGICNVMKSKMTSSAFLDRIVTIAAHLGLADDIKRRDNLDRANASIALEK